jgi:adenylate cyclase
MEEILSAPEKLQLGGTKKKLTILFADVRGFTPISERLQPEEVVSLLNECLTEMADAIFKHEGTLDKFIGDAVLAFFGAPVEHTDDPQRAVRTAWEMQQRIDVVNKRREGGTHGLLKIGIGINTGDVVVGNVGSHRRMDYTVIGDNVNLGQRLEDTAGGGQILISESTYELVKDIVDAVKLEPIKVKGRVQPVQVYEIHGVR